MQRYRADVLIIGRGAAGARAAIAAADGGADVLIAHKKREGQTGATTYDACEIAGYNVPDGAKDPTDSPDAFENDILEAGMGMADPALAHILARYAEESLENLEKWGVSFERQGGEYLVMKGCFSSKARGHIIKGHGKPVMRALDRQINKRSNIRVMQETEVISLLVKNGACAGAVLLDAGGEISAVEAKAVVLASGGASSVFLKNLNPNDVSGDGYRLAHEAGAKLVNMEFMQAGIGFSHPTESLFNTYLWAGLPVVRNALGEEFLQSNLPNGLTARDIMLAHCAHFPFSTRDNSKYIEIMVQREIAEGRGTKRGGVPVSFAKFTPDYVDSVRGESGLRELFPLVLEHFSSQQVDLLRDEIEISCYAQAINGGVSIDSRAMSTLPGLFAAGEVAGGPHGADRLGGNMFVTCQVFGKIAGDSAAAYAAKTKARPLDDTDVLKQCEGVLAMALKVVDTKELERALRTSTQNHLLIGRTERGLLQLQADINAIYSVINSAPKGAVVSRENLSLLGKLSSAELMSAAALHRRESRGSHYREDCPNLDNANFSAPYYV